MPRYQVDTTVIDIPASGAPRTWQSDGGGEPPPSETYRVIVALWESNSGGEAAITNLPSNLLDPLPQVQILINPDDPTLPQGTFQSLHFGFNNNRGHEGQTSATHGFEAGIPEYLAANPLIQAPFYLVQCGQGGSAIGSWAPGSPYRLAMHNRIQAAKTALAALGRTSLFWQIWMSGGINDAIGPGLGPVDLRLATAELIADVRAEIGVGTAAQVCMSQWPEPRRVASPSYLTEMEVNLLASVPNMRMAATGPLPVQDQNHWSSLGYRQGCPLMAATS